MTAPAEPTPTWASRDIGSPIRAGSFSQASGTFTVNGSGRDIGDSSDQFHFAYQQFSGDVELIARVSSLTATDTWAKAGVMIRATLDGQSRHAMMAASRGGGWLFQRRIATGGQTDVDAGPAGAAPGWVRLVREGDLVSAYTSGNGSQWTLVGTDRISMPSSIYVGLAVTSHNSFLVANSAFTNVAVRRPAAGDNQSPTITVTAPAGGATFTAPATITMTASASDPDGSISRVDFYRGSQMVGSDTTAPYSFSWSNQAAGALALTRRRHRQRRRDDHVVGRQRHGRRFVESAADRLADQPGGECGLHRASDDWAHGDRQRFRRLDCAGRFLPRFDADRLRHDQPVLGNLERRRYRHLLADRDRARQRRRGDDVVGGERDGEPGQ